MGHQCPLFTNVRWAKPARESFFEKRAVLSRENIPAILQMLNTKENVDSKLDKKY